MKLTRVLISTLGEATASAISKMLQAAHFGVKYQNTDSGAALTLLRLPGTAKTVSMRRMSTLYLYNN